MATTLFELQAKLGLDTNEFNTGVSTATAQGKTLAEQIGADAESIKSAFSNAFSFSVGQLMADGFRSALDAAWDFTAESVEVAASVEQTNEKLKQLFGEEGAAQVRSWAETTKELYGVSSQAAKQYAADIAGLWGSETIGFTPEQLLEMSTGLVELTGDLASFHNFSVQETWTKLLSGMRGETEAIEDLGIDLRANAVAPFFDMEPNDWGKLDQRTRILLTYEYTLASTAKAQGDFARTGDTYQNQLAMFNANIEELQSTLGDKLLPTATSLLQFMNALFGDTVNAEEVVGDLSKTFVTTYGEIATTTDNALALVEALERMEQDGVDTDAEYQRWADTLRELQTLIPSVSSLIDEQSGSIIGGTTALRDNVQAWKEDGAAMARSAILEEQYQNVAQQEIATGKAELRYQTALKTWQGYADLAESLRTEAEEYLLSAFPDRYEVQADLYENQYGRQDRSSGLLWQLKQRGKKDATAKALYDALSEAESSRQDSWYGDELQAWQDEQAQLESRRAETATLEEVITNIMTEEEKARAREMEALEAERTQLQQAVDAILQETNYAIDSNRNYDPERLGNAWVTLRGLNQNAAQSLVDFLNASGALNMTQSDAYFDSSWAIGDLDITLPKDFFTIDGKDIRIKDWKSELAAFEAARGGQYRPEDYFSGYDSSRSTLRTSEDVALAAHLMSDSVSKAVEAGARAGVLAALGGVSFDIDLSGLTDRIIVRQYDEMRNRAIAGGP